MLSCIPEGEERSPALRGRRLTRAFERLYMILYIGGAYSGLSGSCVRMFAISYAE